MFVRRPSVYKWNVLNNRNFKPHICVMRGAEPGEWAHVERPQVWQEAWQLKVAVPCTRVYMCVCGVCWFFPGHICFSQVTSASAEVHGCCSGVRWFFSIQWLIFVFQPSHNLLCTSLTSPNVPPQLYLGFDHLAFCVSPDCRGLKVKRWRSCKQAAAWIFPPFH